MLEGGRAAPGGPLPLRPPGPGRRVPALRGVPAPVRRRGRVRRVRAVRGVALLRGGRVPGARLLKLDRRQARVLALQASEVAGRDRVDDRVRLEPSVDQGPHRPRLLRLDGRERRDVLLEERDVTIVVPEFGAAGNIDDAREAPGGVPPERTHRRVREPPHRLSIVGVMDGDPGGEEGLLPGHRDVVYRLDADGRDAAYGKEAEPLRIHPGLPGVATLGRVPAVAEALLVARVGGRDAVEVRRDREAPDVVELPATGVRKVRDRLR